jgi:hypothetical protein
MEVSGRAAVGLDVTHALVAGSPGDPIRWAKALKAWATYLMRTAIGGHQGRSSVIKSNRSIKSNQEQSRAIKINQEQSKHSRAIKSNQEQSPFIAIQSYPEQSRAIKINQEQLKQSKQSEQSEQSRAIKSSHLVRGCRRV